MISEEERRRIREGIDRLVLLDDLAFSYAFRNDKKAIQLILKCILGVRRGLKVESVSVQETVKSLYSHSVRFDILARGQDGTLGDRMAHCSMSRSRRRTRRISPRGLRSTCRCLRVLI